MSADRPRAAKIHFHLGLLAAYAPGFGALLTVVLAFLHRRTEGPWPRRLAVLAGVDILVVIALAVLAAGTGLRPVGPPAAPPRPKVGIQLESGDPRIASIAPGSPAADADVRPGDLLVGVDGRPVAATEEAVEALRGLTEGRPAELTLRRDGLEHEVRLTPRAGPWRTTGLFEPTAATGESPSLGWTDLLPFLLAGGLAAWTVFRGGAGPPAWPAFFLVYLGALLFTNGTAYAFAVAQGGLSIGALLTALAVQSLVFGSGALLAAARSRFVPASPAEPLPPGKTVLLGLYYLLTCLPRAAILIAVVLALPFDGIPRPEDPVGRLAEAPLGAAGTALLAINVVLLAPIAEELLFRGYLLPRLAVRLGPPAALGATAVLFAALHTHYGALAMVLVVHGVVLGWARLRSGGLAAPIVLHMLVNAVALTVGLLGR